MNDNTVISPTKRDYSVEEKLHIKDPVSKNAFFRLFLHSDMPEVTQKKIFDKDKLETLGFELVDEHQGGNLC